MEEIENVVRRFDELKKKFDDLQKIVERLDVYHVANDSAYKRFVHGA